MICAKFGLGKMLDGKFCSDWPFTICSKNSKLTKVQPDHNSKMAVKKFHNKDIRMRLTV